MCVQGERMDTLQCIVVQNDFLHCSRANETVRYYLKHL